MPWEETKAYIRSGHRDPDLFLRIRTITLSEEQGIKALIGPLKSDPHGPTVIQSYLFSKKEGWTMPKAKAWFRKHESPSLKFMRKLLFPRLRAKIKGRRIRGQEKR